MALKPAAAETLRADVVPMIDLIAHRGPDAEGIWTDVAAGFAMGHRRLSVVDLSSAGAQPMVSKSGRYVIAYNGEIYNAGEIRAELGASASALRGHSDTEVLLEACAAWGVDRAVGRCIGMFAFALWDRETRRLWLVRDRLGIKPMHWALFGDHFLFGSELKSLTAHPGWKPRLDRAAVATYLRFNYIAAPRTIYQGVSKLPPGAILEYRAGEAPQIRRFWTAEAAVRNGLSAPLCMSDSEAADELEVLLGDAVRRRMIADVPIGAFLSGGIDSSTVVALMQAHSSSKVHTFSIGFQEDGYNEACYAKAVAAHLGTDHTEFYVTPAEAREVIPLLPAMYDEPFGDASQIPTYLVSRLTRGHVTVALSGDGGDELFCGYSRYFDAGAPGPFAAHIPRPVRAAAARALQAIPLHWWDRALRPLPGSLRDNLTGERIHCGATALAMDPDAAYIQTLTHWDNPGALMGGVVEPASVIGSKEARRVAPRYTDRLQYVDTVTYLPDDILTKVDRASMAVSLEVRVPIIDHRVVEFAWCLPPHMKLRNGQGKWLLRQVLARHVPAALVDRKKMGFGLPVGDWLRGPLRDWAETLLSEEALAEDGLIDPEPVRARWKSHLEGRENWQYPLWTMLSLQAWRRANPQVRAA